MVSLIRLMLRVTLILEVEAGLILVLKEAILQSFKSEVRFWGRKVFMLGLEMSLSGEKLKRWLRLRIARKVKL